MDVNDLLIECECGDCEHMALLRTYPWDKEEDWVYLIVHLANWKNVFQRIRIAIRYVMGRKGPALGDFDEVMISPKEALRMVNFLQTHLASVASNDKAEK